MGEILEQLRLYVVEFVTYCAAAGPGLGLLRPGPFFDSCPSLGPAE